jgi:hypothetical protein
MMEIAAWHGAIPQTEILRRNRVPGTRRPFPKDKG